MHVVDVMQSLTSLSQSFAFSSGRDTRNRRVSINQPKTTFCSDKVPSARCFVILIMSFLLVASLGSIGLKNACNVNGTECFRRSMLSLISAPAWNISSMKLSLMMFLGGRGTANSLACSKVMHSGRYVGGLFTNSKVEEREFGCHVGSRDKSHATSVIVSLMILKIEGAGDDPNGSLTSKYAISLTIVIHVTADFIDA